MNISLEKKDVERKASALSTILQDMNVPDSRKEVSNVSNIRWLNRNLGIENGDHPMLETAKELLAFILRKYFLLRRH